MKFPIKGRGRTYKAPGTMNGMEKAYSELLRLRHLAGEVAWFKYEGITLKLAPDTRYTPDFAVVLADGTMEMHETKGHWEPSALVKIKCAAEMFPFLFVGVTKDKSGWNYRRFGE